MMLPKWVNDRILQLLASHGKDKYASALAPRVYSAFFYFEKFPRVGGHNRAWPARHRQLEHMLREGV